MKTSVLIRILLIIVLSGAMMAAMVLPTRAIEEVLAEVGGGQFNKPAIAGGLALCILILAMGPLCVRWLFGDEDSDSVPDVELPQGAEKCEFCSKVIGRAQAPYVIKNHIVCQDCYSMIKEAKK